jgi:hypothetical protein
VRQSKHGRLRGLDHNVRRQVGGQLLGDVLPRILLVLGRSGPADDVGRVCLKIKSTALQAAQFLGP